MTEKVRIEVSTDVKMEVWHRMRQTLDWSICSSQLTPCVDFWVLLTEVSCTRLTVLSDGPGRPVCFAAHRQPLCWNFLYHSWIVLSVGGSPWYLVKNLRCTFTIDSVLANSKTACVLMPCPHGVLSRLHLSSETCKYTMMPITQTNVELFSTYWCAPLCCVYLGCCAVQKFRRDLWISLYFSLSLALNGRFIQIIIDCNIVNSLPGMMTWSIFLLLRTPSLRLYVHGSCLK
jgi:hypothetical protein